MQQQSIPCIINLKNSSRNCRCAKNELLVPSLFSSSRAVMTWNGFIRPSRDDETSSTLPFMFLARFKAVTIPISNHGYVARNIVDGEEFKYLRPKNNPVEIFNMQALTNEKPYCVITEGEIDASSFETVGINAIALGSANNTEKFFGINKSQSKTYILALDSDDRGQQAKKEIEQYFNNNGMKYLSFDCCGEKDPNVALVTNKQQFEKAIKEIVKTTMTNGSEL